MPDTAAGDSATDAGLEATDPAATSPGLEASVEPNGPPSGDTMGGATLPTQPLTRDSSSEWDALPPPIFEAGKVVFDKYRLIEKIGEGGMGEVWRVWHVSLETERALKLIKPEIAHNEKGWLRFQREARLMAKINHPNAVAVYDFRRSRSVAYIEMEFVRGRSLSQVLKEGGDQPMPLEWTARVLEQLCEVLQEAHGHQDETTGQPRPIIHRDLKPSNLMLVERRDDTGPPRLKVLDFGIAKIAEEEGSPELTGAGDILGTPAYMSPEQIRSGFERDSGYQEIDGRSDLYSTGVVLYHLLTGTLPFRGSRMAMLAAHLHTSPIPMKEVNPNADIPPGVERVVMHCLDKTPANRPQTARALAEAFLEAAGIGAAGPQPRTEMTTVVVPEVPVERPRIPATRIAAAAVAVLVLIAGLAVIGFVMIRGRARISKLAPPGNPGVPVVTADITPVAPPVTRKAGTLWAPRGYEAVDPERRVADRDDLPMQLRRKADGVRFDHFAEGTYLPAGYAPESQNELMGKAGWPRVIVRQKDKVRFIRIQGATYLRGDPRTSKAAVDQCRNALSPHYVHVPGFYIQEVEVTNGEIESYQREHVEEKPNLESWASWYGKFQGVHLDPNQAHKFPAVRVGYLAAGNYARSVGGLVPTEAEWEWAAKSCNESFWFAWGEEFTPEGKPSRARLDDTESTSFGPVAGKTYPEDRTQQDVYDMVGNVREICADAYQSYSDLGATKGDNAASNPLIDRRTPVDPNADGVKIVVRGGSFHAAEQKAMAFYRCAEDPNDIPDDVGFRVVIECPAQAEEGP